MQLYVLYINWCVQSGVVLQAAQCSGYCMFVYVRLFLWFIDKYGVCAMMCMHFCKCDIPGFSIDSLCRFAVRQIVVNACISSTNTINNTNNTTWRWLRIFSIKYALVTFHMQLTCMLYVWSFNFSIAECREHFVHILSYANEKVCLSFGFCSAGSFERLFFRSFVHGTLFISVWLSQPPFVSLLLFVTTLGFIHTHSRTLFSRHILMYRPCTCIWCVYSIKFQFHFCYVPAAVTAAIPWCNISRARVAPFNTNDLDLSPFLDLMTSFYYLNNQQKKIH